MQIFVRVMYGRTITLSVERNESVESLKEKIWEREAVPVDVQRLFYGGKYLAPGGVLSDFGVEEEVTLQLGFASKMQMEEKKVYAKETQVCVHVKQRRGAEGEDNSSAKRRCVQI